MKKTSHWMQFVEREAWTGAQEERNAVRRLLARSLRLIAARGSMASWALPYEAIVAALLVGDGDRHGKRRGPRT